MEKLVIRWKKLQYDWDFKEKCLRCGVEFTELKNMGKWECSHHPGRKIVQGYKETLTDFQWRTVPVPVWSCCNKKVVPFSHDGCKRCDHSSTKWIMGEEDDVRNIYVGWLKELKPLPQAVSDQLGADIDSVIIRRFE